MGTMSPPVGKSPSEGGPSPLDRRVPFAHFVARVRADVEARLGPWLGARVAEARTRGADVFAVADALGHLVLRGGKRMRAVLLAAGYVAAGGEDPSAVAPAGAALELLQAYLLTHDDWMDGDDMRRGGPSVPAMMQAHFATGNGGAAGAAAILAGDLAASWALRSMLELSLPPDRVVRALREFARAQEEVVEGQVLDVCAGSGALDDVEAVYSLKTASYTVRAPVVMGARLAGAGDGLVATLAAFAEPLGVAFQLRDDLLGAFGDPAATGKPRGGDLRKGKRTALLVEGLRDPGAAHRLNEVVGRRDAEDSAIAGALEVLEACGARARVEARIGALAGEARAALARAEVSGAGRELLAQAIAALTERDR
jgi:geranylgeranyl diphosphate synthase type I